MRYFLRTLMACAILFSVTLLSGTAVAQSTPSTNKGSSFEHIFYIMMENHARDQILGNTADAPYINELASKYEVANQFYGVTHPSLPNYLAAISGDNQGIWDDCKAGAAIMCSAEDFEAGDFTKTSLLTPAQLASSASTPHWFSATNIVDQLEARGLSWKAYMQSLPSVGYTGEYWPVLNVKGVSTPVKLYAQKHDPFMYFSSIRNNPDRVKKIVPYGQLADDLSEGNVPNFVWISPDQCNDMHSISAAGAALVGQPNCVAPAKGLDHSVIHLGDNFLQSVIPSIMSSKAWTEKSAIIVSWDEDDYAGFQGCCHSPTGVNGVTLGGSNAPFMVITSKHPHHYVDNTTPYNHYSVLATIEKLWHMDCLANACGFSKDELLTKFF